MVRFGKFVLAAFTTAALSLGNIANAGVIYDNTANLPNGYDTAIVDGPLYNSFSTGGTALPLTDVKLKLDSTNASSNKSFTVSLVSDNSNKPGTSATLLATIADSAVSTSGSIIDVSVGSIALSANTRYWIEVNAGGVSSVRWGYSPDLSGTNITGEYFAYYPGGVLTVSQKSTQNTPFLMQVTTSASSVPEPSTLSLALSALGIGVVAIARRRAIRS